MEERMIKYNDETLLKSATNSNFKIYMLDIFKYPVLSKEETYKLGIKNQNGDKEAGEKLIFHNLRLVVWVIKFIKNRLPETTHLKEMDLIQVGNLALMKSAKDYDPKIGAFSTYAKSKIESDIRRIIKFSEKEISCKNSDVLSKTPAYLKFIEKYEIENGETPSDEVIAKGIDVKLSTLELIKLNLKISTTSANVKVGEDEEDEIIDFLESPISTEENIISKMSEYEFIITIKQLLSPREYYVIYYRYLSPVVENNSSMAKRLNGVASRQQLDNIEKQALKKLKLLEINNNDRLSQIFSKLVNLEGMKAYNLRETPIDIESLITYSYIKDVLTEKEKELLNTIIFGKYKYTDNSLVQTLHISLKELHDLYDSIEHKTLICKKDTEKYQAYRTDIVSDFKTSLFNIESIEELDNYNKKLKLTI